MVILALFTLCAPRTRTLLTRLHPRSPPFTYGTASRAPASPGPTLQHHPAPRSHVPSVPSLARLIFQRAATVRLNARRVRSLLKRFLEFEEAHGTPEQQQAVREMARQYVETRAEADAAAVMDTR